MNWPLYIFFFFIISLIVSIGVTLLKVWVRRKTGKEVKSTVREKSYQRPF
ncbi:hypothetical protein GXP67_34120 [Rhodocytophaga rosea]|uniref:Uncharacterized protein n=1 Tax=Rhodocytophaga rosea TaxID=2704465 RepID=A0A6C0GTU8_9BACT|nr:hypothetical protein [Rhodocytophaga rosea]QHT71337.1 hypothetical protein GXP67_34120 [Rhodocytophaga rosea]